VTRSQNLGAFRGLDPKTQDVLGSFRRDAERDIDGLVADRRDQPVRVRSRRSDNWHVGILEEAELQRATLIVLGVAVRSSDALSFGETANRLLYWRQALDRLSLSRAEVVHLSVML
jgi:hypothetical protein